MIIRRLDYVEIEIKKLTEFLRLLLQRIMKSGSGNSIAESLASLTINQEDENYRDSIKKLIECDESEVQLYVEGNPVYSETNIKLVADILFNSPSEVDNKKALILYELLLRMTSSVNIEVFNNMQVLQHRLNK